MFNTRDRKAIERVREREKLLRRERDAERLERALEVEKAIFKNGKSSERIRNRKRSTIKRHG